mgnify:CR=1 FL=1
MNFKPEAEDDNSLMEQIKNAYGSDGLGILAVSGVPDMTDLRQILLPLAAKIPKLPQEELQGLEKEEFSYAVGWSHGKEKFEGVPDLSKGSFYANPLVNDLVQAMLERQKQRSKKNNSDEAFKEELGRLVREHPAFFAPNVFPKSIPELEGAISNMGQCIASVGRLVARVCQAYCKNQGVHVELEKILSESLNCKARLLHYFDTAKDKDTTASTDADDKPFDEKKEDEQKDERWWCGWHNDHGSLTGLVPAMYLGEDGKKQASQSPDPLAGLYIQSRSGEMVQVKLPSDCLGFQIGETFQILSGGLLQATPHAVKQSSATGWTRET